MQVVGEKSLEFEGFTLDLARGCLRRAEDEIKLRPMSFRLLHYLARNAGRLVSKGDIIGAVWPDVVVTDESLARCVSDVRLALHDVDQQIIKTVPRRGYLFAARVSPAGTGAAPAAAPSGRPDEVAVGREKPGALAREVEPAAPRLSVVVLPFVNLGGDTTSHDFADSITENLTTDLSRIPGAFVIARNTAFAYRDQAVDVRKIGRELGVRYIVEGSIQGGRDRVRVNAQLIDAESGAHLWADRFDKMATNTFEVQDEIIARLVRALALEMVHAESQRAERERPDQMDATDLAMRGWAQYSLPFSFDGVWQSRKLFEAALRLDERNVDALIGLANGHTAQVMNWAWDDAAEHLSIAEAAVSKALSLSPGDARAHYARARLLEVSLAPELALREYEITIALDPNLPSPHGRIALTKVYLGRAEEAEAHVTEAIRLSPRDPMLGEWHFDLGLADLYLGRLDRAVHRLRRSVEINPKFELAYFYLAAALALSGCLSEAAATRETAQRLMPRFSIGRFRARPRSNNPIYLAQRERIIEGMRMAGVPE